MLRVCEECSAEFEAPRAKTCSKSCASRAWRRRKGMPVSDAPGVSTFGMKECDECGVEFVRRHPVAMFCSSTCRYTAVYKRPGVKEKNRDRNRARYQDDPEYRDAVRERTIARDRARGVRPASTGTVENCGECGEQFVGRLGKRFCGKKCLKRSAWRRTGGRRRPAHRRATVGALSRDGSPAKLQFEQAPFGGFWVYCLCGRMAGVPDHQVPERRECRAGCGSLWVVNMEEMQAVRDVPIAC